MATQEDPSKGSDRSNETTDADGKTYPPRETWRRLPDGWRWVGEPHRMSEQRQAAWRAMWRAMWRMLLDKAAALALEERQAAQIADQRDEPRVEQEKQER